MNYILLQISFIIIFLIISAFFSGIETVLFSLTKSDLHKFSESKNSVENRIFRLMKDPEKILITILLGNLFVNLSLTAVTTNFMLHYFGHYGHIIAIALITPLVIIFSEITPKIAALNNYISLSKSFYPYINLFHLILSPVRFCIIFYSDMLIKLLNLNLGHSKLTEDEIGHVIADGEKKGLIHKEEGEILKNVLRFTKKEASNVMYPRNQAFFINYGAAVDEAMSLIIEKDIVKLPVYKDNIDNIVGVIDSRDMMSTYLTNKNRKINKFIRPIDFFPFSKELNELLNDFLERKIEISIVVDEYGGTAGVVTLNSILSALLGKDFGRWETSKKDMVRQTGEGRYIVYGEMQLDDFNAYFNLNIISNNSDTIGGYFIEESASIPEKGDSITIENFELRIKSIIKRTIKTIEVESSKKKGKK
ncbi:MAG: hemolysin family protein [Leptospirales bacterium]|nr:hemolysin family protein [Leptospirales bacterium]